VARTYPSPEVTIMLLEVPVIDVAPFRSGDPARRRVVAQAAGQAVNDIGFLVITGHGVDP
jgi:isopenicillin N synthase-like dioxygenase